MARTARPGVTVSMDSTQAGAALGAIQGMTSQVKTDRFTGSVLKYAHAEMAHQFDIAMEMAYGSNPSSYSHVFDINDSGKPVRKLWKHILVGRGANREATFQFLASKLPIPTPEMKKAMGDKNLSLISDADLAQLSDRRYVFRWKAPIMEYSLRVSISPKYAQALFVPTGNANRPFIITRQQIVIDNPGGQETTGRFVSFWTSWWSQGAPKVFDETVKKIVEKDLGRTPVEAISRKRSKKVGLVTTADFEAAFENGRELAAAYIDGRADSYNQASSYIERTFW